MTDTELISIGTFARRSGLTASALRFYDDSGVLRPADVDAASGYRYYHHDQLERAVAVRRLRELDMPLVTVDQVLTADPTRAARLIDEHVATLSARADAARRLAVEVKTALAGEDAVPLATVKGPVLAAAVDQVLVATGEAEDYPAISGVRLEVSGDSLTLTATDRYRLAVRTLVPEESSGTEWSATVSGHDLRAVLGEIRRRHVVRLEAVPDGVRFHAVASTGWRDAGGGHGGPGQVSGDVHCRLLDGAFPDHHALVAGLAEPVTRVVAAKDALLRAIESRAEPTIRLQVRAGECVLAGSGEASRHVVEAAVEGADAEMWFGAVVLHPAVATAVGPDVMLDIRGPSEPVTVRSADNGDLATHAMPHEPPVEA
ncbi:DNA-binding transcriptional MerR regulator [Prauserella sediminis]|uniref:DNA-binding transcriptional MerR regulator n=1 Tax=Prauserella sediminis TaxID=577680 RepID=A0A839XTP5_9PSEU|nr:MerR family transcriptional regulator [Prauserella sediminis]MBB3663376.1 DNA-binding transcriptional MerR regulator [Prauserella sediminis]